MRDWTKLCRVANEIEAQLVAGYLESFGIAVDVESKRFPQYPENLGMLGAFVIRVPLEELSRAEELLAELPQAEIADVPELAGDESPGSGSDESPPDREPGEEGS